MKDDKKKSVAAVIAARLSPASPKIDSAADEAYGKDAVAEELMDAIHRRDINAMRESMKSFVSMCNDEYGSESEEGPQSE